jgi:hypothetical protein
MYPVAVICLAWQTNPVANCFNHSCASCCNVFLLQIQKIMEDKGYDHAAAFTRQRQAEAAAKEVEGGSGEGGAAFGAAHAKKRRI